MWQQVVVAICIGWAALQVVRGIRRWLGSSPEGCGGCGDCSQSCSAESVESAETAPLVGIDSSACETGSPAERS